VPAGASDRDGISPTVNYAARAAGPTDDMKHSVSHDLSPELAKTAANKAFAAYAERFAEYRPVMRWLDEQRSETSFTVKGITLRGTIELAPRAILIDLDVPFLLRPFKAKAIDVIEREIRVWVERAQAGQL